MLRFRRLYFYSSSRKKSWTRLPLGGAVSWANQPLLMSWYNAGYADRVPTKYGTPQRFGTDLRYDRGHGETGAASRMSLTAPKPVPCSNRTPLTHVIIATPRSDTFQPAEIFPPSSCSVGGKYLSHLPLNASGGTPGRSLLVHSHEGTNASFPPVPEPAAP